MNPYGPSPVLTPSGLVAVELRLRALLSRSDPLALASADELVLRPSKRVRAALVLAAAEAVELPHDLAVDVAAVIELVHAFSLVHDDIEDGALERRGRPSVHAVDGVAVALNAGDALHALAWQAMLMLDAPPAAVVALGRVVGAALAAIVAGQGRDLVWTRDRREDVSVTDYVAMVRGKTGALLGLAAAAPAILAGLPAAARLQAFGEELGIAFQALDDIGAAVSPAAGQGKPAGPGVDGASSLISILARDSSDPVADALDLVRDHAVLSARALAAAGLADAGPLWAIAERALSPLRTHVRLRWA